MPMRPRPMGREPEHPGRRISDVGPVAGCLPGTLVLTQDGEIPVEYLTPGEQIITREAGYAPLLELRRVGLITRAVHVAREALGPQRPSSDLILPADQPLLLRGEAAQSRTGRPQALIRAGGLTDGVSVCDLGLKRLKLYTLVFETRQVIYAGGLELSGAIPAGPAMRRAA